MRSEELFRSVPVEGILPAEGFDSVVSDSRRVTAGCLFCCIAGRRRDGHDFAADAVRRGAAAVLAERPVEGVERERLLLTPSTRLAESLLWHNLTRRAADGMKKIAVTGTAGKTSVVFLLAAMLKAAGLRVGMLTTPLAEADGRPVPLGENGGSSVSDIPGAMTTPDPEFFFGAATRMRDAGCGYFLYEASSESLALRKTAAITPDIAVFTNLSPEHLDSHGTMEEYFRAKASLFDGVPLGVVNADDAWAARLPLMYPRTEFIRCAVRSNGSGGSDGSDGSAGAAGGNRAVGAHDAAAADIRSHGLKGIGYTYFSARAAFRAESPLIGRFSVYNTMQAAACALRLGVDAVRIREALAGFRGVPGRMCPVPTADRRAPAVFIDYAHTPEALRAALGTLRECLREDRSAKGARLIALFGCGGDRDRSKRPLMAKAAQEFADEVVVTSDNPRTEDPDAIFGDILAGIDKTKPFVLIPDRERAVRYAVGLAREGDAVLLAGKGHEKYEITADGKRPFDEEEIARGALAERPGAREQRI